MSVQQIKLDRRLIEWLLDGEWEFAGPRKALVGLSPDDACRPVPGLPYTIAQLLAHAEWWQRRRIDSAQGAAWEDFELQVDDWPAVAPADWDQLVQSFLASCAELADLVGNGLDSQRAVCEDLTVGAMLVSHTLHNAYHLGQIVLLRRLLGLWPPEESEDDAT